MPRWPTRSGAGFPLDELRDDEDTLHWRRLMLAEACRAKEAVFFKDSVVLKLVPPGWNAAPDAVPACSLGEPETFFKLVICEIGRGEGPERRFVWDAADGLHKVGGDDGPGHQVVIPLNAANPTLGYLNPPHQPGDRRPRLEVAFGVSQERWLVATVRDLYVGKEPMRAQPVVRLL